VTQFDLILHFLIMLPVVNMSGKFDANIFIRDRYVAILLHRWFGCERPIHAYFGEFFGLCYKTASIK